MGPSHEQPCGVADYVRRLGAALAPRCHLIPVSYREALSDPALGGCLGILVHYERSLVPDPGYLDALAARHPGKVYVVPHEVYAEDPFAFPYAGLRASFPLLLRLKRLRYRWLHRDYARERELQRRAYGAHRVIPLSREGGDILRSLAARPDLASRVLPPVPHARFDPPASRPAGAADAGGAGAAALRKQLFPGNPRVVLGIFGFLNPGLDYGSALDLLSSLGPEAALAVLGGERGSRAPRETGLPVRAGLEAEALRRGLAERVRVTGYLPEGVLPDYLALCDLFVSPMRFKSNSGSVLHLFRTGRPVFVPDLPLTRFLRDEGAPVDIYGGPEELREKAVSVLEGRYRVPEDRYPWDFDRVAEAYLRAVEEARPAETASGPAADQ